MKITQIDLYEVEIPPIPPIAKYFSKIYDLTICRMQTDEGIVGLGETQGKPPQFEAEAASYEGKDPLALDPFAQSDPFTCALLDIAGQAFGSQAIEPPFPGRLGNLHVAPLRKIA